MQQIVISKMVRKKTDTDWWITIEAMGASVEAYRFTGRVSDLSGYWNYSDIGPARCLQENRFDHGIDSKGSHSPLKQG